MVRNKGEFGEKLARLSQYQQNKTPRPRRRQPTLCEKPAIQSALCCSQIFQDILPMLSNKEKREQHVVFFRFGRTAFIIDLMNAQLSGLYPFIVWVPTFCRSCQSIVTFESCFAVVVCLNHHLLLPLNFLLALGGGKANVLLPCVTCLCIFPFKVTQDT